MRGLTAIVADAASDRLRTALMLALTIRALDARARVLLDAPAVALLTAEPDEQALIAAGLPSRAALIDDAVAAGVELILCQTGLTLHGLSADAVEPPWRTGGMVEVMASLADDRLVVV